MLKDKIRKILENCNTTEEWKNAAIVIAGFAYEKEDLIFDMQGVIAEMYGEKALQEIMDKVGALRNPEEIRIQRLATLHDYGYTKDDMATINLQQALERFELGQPVHLLMPDNTEKLAGSEDEIRNFGGYMGITTDEMDDMVNTFFDAISKD